MDENYIAAIDLGSAFITLTVAKIYGEDIQILYYKKHKSDGIRNSAVFNPEKASAPIRAAIEEAEKELKIKILQVVVGLPRCDIRQETATATVERTNPDDSITKEEVESLKSMAQNTYPLQDPEKDVIYGAFAQSFSDDENFQLIEDDIIGVISRNFEGNFKLFIGKKSAVKTVDKIFNKLGIALVKKYFSPIAQAKAVLTEDETSSGVALIDIGSGATSVTIYQGNILRYYASIPFGGKVITSDIRSECFIPEKLAENIKLAFGACIPEKLLTLGEKIIQIEGNEHEGFKQIPVKYLSEIITARVKEITDAMLYEIQKSGLADNLRGGIVITGGGANLANIALYIKDISGYNVRIGYPRRKFSASGYPSIFDPDASTALGMILTAKEDNLTSCIEEPMPDPEILDNQPITPVQPVQEEPGAEVPAEQPEVQVVENEPIPTSLFGEDTVKATEEKGWRSKRKKEKENKEEEDKKPGIIKLTWKRFKDMLDDLSNEMDNQNV
ncbi:MAG: cell division protein FtsA [Bacteroidales bacterium]|nr:cell division protein FtsA [Bacteroidales bacterium]